MALVVQKFGGTSVADPERIRAVADHVARTKRRGDDVVVVVSAMGKETDELLRLAAEVSSVRPGREMDMLITAGERKATALLCMALHDLGVAGRQSFTGSQAGFITDTTHTNAKIVEVRPDRIQEALDAGHVPVVGGAQGVSTERNVTFLGRGGSDTTAVALAHALGADSCELYTDVPGRVHQPTPGSCPDARKLEHRQLRRDARDDRQRLPQAGHAVGRVRPHLRACACTSAQRSPGSPAPGCTEEDPSMEQAIISAVVHDTSEAKVTVTRRARPARHRRPAVPARSPTPTSTST